MVRETLDFLKVPPRMGIDEWAAEYRFLSPEAAAEPGKYLIERAEYQRGIMQAISDPSVQEVTLMCSSQVGKTEIVLNVVGYHIHYDPAPILVVQPTLEMATSFSKERLANMIRDCPVLNGKVKDARSRDSGNTMLHKQFPMGHITMCGANSAAGLASRPIRIVLLDEVDRYPPSAGSEGDPVKLAVKRSKTFWNRKIVKVSSPTVKDISRIEADFLESSQAFFHVPCPHCGYAQRLIWKQVKWEAENVETAAYECEKCAVRWTDGERFAAIRKGHWVHTYPEVKKKGFHLSEIYSSWTMLHEMATAFLEAKKFPELLKAFINTALGETWEEQGQGLEEIPFMARRENYTPESLPVGVVVIVAGIDVQDDRIEIETIGFGEEEEVWSVEYEVIYGDLSVADPWNRLDEFLKKMYKRVDGLKMPIVTAAIDSGGHFTQSVYNFTRGKSNRRIWAIKGKAGEGEPIWPKRPSVRNIGKVPLFSVGVDSAKDIIFARLKIEKHGAGYCHFPMYDEEYFEQLTAEKVVVTYKKGRPVRTYKKTKQRNEALDCRVYGYAAFLSLKVNIRKLAEKQQVLLINGRKEGEKKEVVEKKRKKTVKKEVKEKDVEKHLLKEKKKVIRRGVNNRRPPGGYINSWRY